jgi:hypothetical protein
MLPIMRHRENVLSSLRGNEVTIPDLYPILAGWEGMAINPCYERLVPVSNQWLQR